MSKTNSITKDELLTLIAKGKRDFEPDAKHSYSNSGYALLGLILEKLSGKPYGEDRRNPDFLNAELFATAFRKSCEEIRGKVGVLMFVFSVSGPPITRMGAISSESSTHSLEGFQRRGLTPSSFENRQWLHEEYFK